MERYTAYQSGLHAAMIALQLYWGVDRAVTLIEPYWDILPRPQVCTAHTLADILVACGLPASARLLPAVHTMAGVSQIAARHEFATFETRKHALARDRRWGVLMSETDTEWKWAECVGEGEVVVTPASPRDDLTGWHVYVQRVMPRPARFYARDNGEALPQPIRN